MGYIALCLFGGIIQASFLIAERRKKYLLAFVIKVLAVMAYVCLGTLCAKMSQNHQFERPIMYGLIVCSIADLLFCLRYVFLGAKKPLFVAGLLSYLVSHAFYIYAFIQISDDVHLCLILGIVAGLICSVYMFRHLDKLKYFYSTFNVVYLCSSMVLTALSLFYMAENPRSNLSLVYALAMAILTISDILLVSNAFSSKKKYSVRVMTISFCYVAQLLIAAGLLFV